MRKIWVLAITLLKSGLGQSDKKKQRSRWFFPLLLLFAFFSFATSIYAITSELYDVLAAGGVADVILPIAFGATCVVIFVFGIFYVVSTMYHAGDISRMLALPLRPYHILGAKFLTLVAYEYIFESFILLPILVAFGVKSSAGILYIVYSAALFVLTPVIPLTIASLIVMIVMRFTSFGKNKQVFNFVGGIIALALALGFNIGIQSGVSNLTEAQLLAIASGQSSLVSLMSGIFPGLIFAANTLIFSEMLAGLGSFALFVLCSCGAAAVFLGVGQLVYFKGVAGVTETSAKRREISSDALGKKIKREPVLISYIKKEIRLLVRSPITFMNCVLMNLIWPILIIVIIAGQGRSVAEISRFISTGDPGVILAIIVGMSAFVSSSNAVTSTAISREGSQLYFMKYVPVEMGRQLYAKITTGFIISSTGIILIVIAAVVLGLQIGVALAALVLSLAVTAVCSVIGILIDAARPKLTWMNEQQAVKQNLNVVLHMLAGLVVGLAVVLPVLFIPMTLAVVLVYIAVLIVLMGIVFSSRVSRGAVVRLQKMDA